MLRISFDIDRTLLPIFFLALISCAPTKEYPAGLVLKGVMHFTDIEGGCWVFKADDGQAYELIGKDVKRLQKDGLRAEIFVRPRTDLASICMMGKIVEVIEIIKIYN